MNAPLLRKRRRERQTNTGEENYHRDDDVQPDRELVSRVPRAITECSVSLALRPWTLCDNGRLIGWDMCFANEKMLVSSFVSRLSTDRSPWGMVQVATEFNYQRGRTDIIAYTADESVIAVEAKLVDWRTALHQAFRNRCFANRSYVLLPKDTAMRAHRFVAEFDRRQVGICYLGDTEIVVLHSVAQSVPLEPWLSRRAKLHIEAAGAGA